MKIMVEITGVLPHSRAARAGIEVGDILLEINGYRINDVLDYRFRLAEEKVTLKLHRGPEIVEVKIKKDTYDDIGLEFGTPLMDKKHRCENGCIFCFIDQNPQGMRESIYFKDDDSRLAFLHGNYITLTNLHEEDIDRIIEMHISPVNVSVHTTNPELRVKMMKNKRSGEVLSYLRRLADAGISLCTQLVLCPGINDGEELMRSMHDLVALCPSLISCAAVPVGITKFRDGLYPLRTYTKEEARAVIETVNSFGDYCRKEYGSRIFTAADEFYLKAEMDIPSEEYYEDYPQLENGVGLIRSVKEDLRYYLADSEPFELKKDRRVLAVTGVAAYPTVCELSEMIKEKADRLCVDVLCVKNDFFGETVTVAGLLTATDIEKAVKEHIKNTGASYDALIIPDAALKADEDVFLDGVSLTSLSDRLGIHAVSAKNEPCDMVSAFLFG